MITFREFLAERSAVLSDLGGTPLKGVVSLSKYISNSDLEWTGEVQGEDTIYNLEGRPSIFIRVSKHSIIVRDDSTKPNMKFLELLRDKMSKFFGVSPIVHATWSNPWFPSQLEQDALEVFVGRGANTGAKGVYFKLYKK